MEAGLLGMMLVYVLEFGVSLKGRLPLAKECFLWFCCWPFMYKCCFHISVMMSAWTSPFLGDSGSFAQTDACLELSS